MKQFLLEELTLKESYKLLSGTVLPRPIALVATLHENDKVNLAPFSFFNVVSSDPAILSISVQRKDGVMKDTARNILKNKEAVLHMVDEEILEDANQTAIILPINESEVDHTNFSLVDSEFVITPGISQAKVRYETTLHQHIEIKNNEGITTSDFFLLKVKALYVSESIYENTYIQVDKFKPIARLAGNHYAKMGEEINIERP